MMKYRLMEMSRGPDSPKDSLRGVLLRKETMGLLNEPRRGSGLRKSRCSVAQN